MKYKKRAKKRRRNPIGVATNPKRKRRAGGKKRRRRNPTNPIGGFNFQSLVRRLNVKENAARGAGVVLNLWGLTKAPAKLQAGAWKYAWLFGVPLLLAQFLKHPLVHKAAEGGVIAGLLHLGNDFLPDPFKGNLLPGAFVPGGAGLPEVPTVEGLGGYETPQQIGGYETPQQIGAGDDDDAVDFDEMEAALVSGIGAYDDVQGIGFAPYEATSGLGQTEQNEIFRIS